MNGFVLKRLAYLCALCALLMLMLVIPCTVQAEETQAGGSFGLIISEAQSNNDTDWMLGFHDYIEVYNAGDESVMLSDYFLTRDEADPFSCHLPAVELGSDSYALLICDVDLLDFRLSKEGCELFLYHRNGTLCDDVELPAMENNVWQAEHGLTQQPSPGYPNTAEGAAAYRATFSQTLIVSEVVSSNSKLLPQNDEYNDLIELQNIGEETVNLSQYYLSDKKKNPFLWQLPNVELAPGECYVVQASGSQNGHEAPFKIPATGEAIYISDRNGQCIDALYVPPLMPDTSYGRSGDALFYYDLPSIGRPNTDGFDGITQTPQASQDSGPLSGPVHVTLSGEGEIYYTLDGRTPSGKSARYDGTPIAISKNTVLRVRAVKDGKLWSRVGTYTYLMDAQKYELPLLCISAEPGAIMGANGIYTLYKSKSREAVVNMTLIENGVECFSVDCGLKIHGQGSRQLPKKSFQVRFRAKYGCGRLEYKLFENSPVTSFNALVLRCGSEDATRAFFRDEFLTSLTAQTMPEVLYQRHKPVNLFIDGEYFGVYYIRERVTDAFAASYLGGEEDDVDMIQGWSIQEHGSRDDWMALLRYCRKHNLSDEEAFNHVASQISLESFMDYYIARAYSGDRDYTNIRHVRSRGGDGLWRIVNFDLDWGFGQQPAAFHQMIGTVSDKTALNTVIINALLQNASFRDQMLTRLSWHLRNTYDPERVIAHIDEMAAKVDHDLQYNYEIWGGTYESWLEHVQLLRDFVKSDDSDRVTAMIQSAKRAFRMTEEEMVYYFGDLYTGK
ncbi:MAG: CotH kinase family protein [Clostridia bacterium]|nr:CotH kinase family protein [Clostridia bacterium]